MSDSVTPWGVAHQAPPSMGFSRQEYWSGLPFSSSGDLPDSGIEPRSPALQADFLPSEPPGKFIEVHLFHNVVSVSRVQQNDSVVHICQSMRIRSIFSIFFPLWFITGC